MQINFTEAKKIGFDNYRTNITGEEIAELAVSIKELGQIAPVVVCENFPGCTVEGDLICLDGQRRIMAYLSLESEMPDLLLNLDVAKINNMQEFKARQLAANINRKNTTFCENGAAFARFMEDGGTIQGLVSSIDWPPAYNKAKHREAFIRAKMDYILLIPKLHKYLDNGLIAEAPGKHQLYLIAKYPEQRQKELAAHYKQSPVIINDKELKGWLSGQNFDLKNAHFDLEDPALGFEDLKTAACAECRFTEKGKREISWNKSEETTYCIQPECAERKQKNHLSKVMNEFKDKHPEPAKAGYPDTDHHFYIRDGEEGFINGYKPVDPATCFSAIPAVAGNERMLNYFTAGYICPQSSKCPIHWPDRLEALETKRSERETAAIEKAKTKGLMETINQVAGMLKPEMITSREVTVLAIVNLARNMGSHVIKAVLSAAGHEKELYSHYFNYVKALEIIPQGKEADVLLAAILADETEYGNTVPFWQDISNTLGHKFEDLVKTNTGPLLAERKEAVKKTMEKRSVEELKTFAKMAWANFLYSDVTMENIADMNNERMPKMIRNIGANGTKGLKGLELYNKVIGRLNELRSMGKPDSASWARIEDMIQKIGEDPTYPYELQWTDTPIGALLRKTAEMHRGTMEAPALYDLWSAHTLGKTTAQVLFGTSELGRAIKKAAGEIGKRASLSGYIITTEK